MKRAMSAVLASVLVLLCLSGCSGLFRRWEESHVSFIEPKGAKYIYEGKGLKLTTDRASYFFDKNVDRKTRNDFVNS